MAAIDISDYQGSLQYAGSDDFDGDGITNNTDIDNDNDGVVDAVENPGCFYTSTAIILHQSTAITDLSFAAANPIRNAIDLDAITFTQGTAATQPITDKTIIEIDFPTALPISGITFEMGATPISNSATDGLTQLEGWNGTSWVPLSATKFATVVNGNEVYTNTLGTSGEVYTKVRLKGISGNSDLIRIKNTILDVGPFVPSAFPITGCTVFDTDNDGIPDMFDTDSDQDGCTDAFEAGTSTSNVATVPGTYGANGFADALETSGNGVYIGTYTYSNAINSSVHTCVIDCVGDALMLPSCDFDGDGINNAADLDDDNDGVLDALEANAACPTAAVTGDGKWFITDWNPALNVAQNTQNCALQLHPILPIPHRTNITAGDKNYYFKLRDSYGLPIHALNPTYTSATAYTGGIDDPVTSNTDLFRMYGWINFPASLLGQNLEIRLNPGGDLEEYGWVMSTNYNPANWRDPIHLTTGEYLNDFNEILGFHSPIGATGSSSAYPANYNIGGCYGNIPDYSIRWLGDFTTKITATTCHYVSMWMKDEIIAWNLSTFQYRTPGGAWTNIPASWFNSTSCVSLTDPPCGTDIDTDGDGIANRFDLDSDGDGCTDAVESGVTGIAGVSMLNGNVINGTPNTTTSTPNAVVAGPYDGNGFANSVETSPESGVYKGNYTYDNAIDAGIANCPVTCPYGSLTDTQYATSATGSAQWGVDAGIVGAPDITSTITDDNNHRLSLNSTAATVNFANPIVAGDTITMYVAHWAGLTGGYDISLNGTPSNTGVIASVTSAQLNATTYPYDIIKVAVPASATGSYTSIVLTPNNVGGTSLLLFDAIQIAHSYCNPCAAGSTPPAITTTSLTNTCPTPSVNLTTLTNTGSVPSGTTLVWSIHNPPTSANDTLTTAQAAAISASGTYYAFYRSAASSCFSPADSITFSANLACCPYGVIHSNQYATSAAGNGHADGTNAGIVGIPDVNNDLTDNSTTRFVVYNTTAQVQFANPIKAGDTITIYAARHSNTVFNGDFTVSLNGTPSNTGTIATVSASQITTFANSNPWMPYTAIQVIVPASATGSYSSINLTPTSNLCFTYIDAIQVSETNCNTCASGLDAPTLTAAYYGFCSPATSYNLTTLTASNIPSGLTLSWHTGTPATSANEVANPAAVTDGTYYAAIKTGTGASACYSGINGDGTATTKVVVGADSDCDGVPDSLDWDDDNDGVLDVTEMQSVPCSSGDGQWRFDVYGDYENPNGGFTAPFWPILSTWVSGDTINNYSNLNIVTTNSASSNAMLSSMGITNTGPDEVGRWLIRFTKLYL
ncbi:MAG: hypothetical protein IPH96_13195 [Saprospiraceae bacterium]|nr:hypothetical protein [Saprospiraceae bacterium]